MTGWVRATTLEELWEGEMTSVTLNDRRIVLCHVADAVYAYDDRCPHQANPLSQGKLEDSLLTCAAHEWVFDVRSGHGVNPADACLLAFPVRLDGDTVLVNLEGENT
jgi:toluene monooxygenase system ferredoxin subunit